MTSEIVDLYDEMFYQPAIAKVSKGTKVSFAPDPDNARGERTIKCVNGDGETIGYVEPESWLTKAILDEKRSVLARVHFVIGRDMKLPVHGIRLEVHAGPSAAERALKAGPQSGVIEGDGLLRRYLVPAVLIALLAWLAYWLPS